MHSKDKLEEITELVEDSQLVQTAEDVLNWFVSGPWAKDARFKILSLLLTIHAHFAWWFDMINAYLCFLAGKGRGRNS